MKEIEYKAGSSQVDMSSVGLAVGSSNVVVTPVLPPKEGATGREATIAVTSTSPPPLSLKECFCR